ncbi:phage major capsid protein [Dehalococcoides mccartyi]|uniref:Phage capsid protein n=1 Tax=Dehalococcoides mccartyi TaxID=61435 RepID=A0A142VAP1_9CHLR|nr:phage major capsid protein [Dehalococcoides mccartyi]AMU86671.1 phage capsid protein [Dehalococcoides mccartyi]
MKTITEIKGEIKAKSDLIHKVFAEAGDNLDFDKVTCLQGKTTEEKVAEMNVLDKQLAELNTDYQKVSKLTELRKSADEGVKLASEEPQKPNLQVSKKTIGELIMASTFRKGKVSLDISPAEAFGLKADFFTSSGWAPPTFRQPGYVESPTRPLGLLDYMPVYPTNQNAVSYMLETTFTNSAAEKSEGGAAAESALALTETTQAAQEIATFVPVSKVQLEDVALAEAYLTNRLAFMVRQKLEKQCLEGSGSTPVLLGTLHLGSIQSQAKGSDPTPDAIYKAFNLIRVNGFTEPSVLFINPTDWEAIRLLRTSDGVYIFGSPNDSGINRIWGVPVVQTTAVTANTAITGDYANFAYLAERKGVEVEMSSGYSDYFVKGKLAVLASMRAAMVHTRTTAFATITGI